MRRIRGRVDLVRETRHEISAIDLVHEASSLHRDDNYQLFGGTSEPESRKIVIAGQQRVTADWWKLRRPNFELVVSDAVRLEASRGDSEAALRRIELLEGLRVIPLNDEVRAIAQRLITQGGMPPKAAQDAIHVAAAASGNADFLLTWNCTHIANAELRPRIELICREAGFEPPVICTPIELMENRDESQD